MNEIYETVVAKRSTGKTVLWRVLLVASAVVGCSALAVLALSSRSPVLFLVPILLLWFLFGFVWRHLSVEYELSCFGGTLSVSAVYGKRSRRPRFEGELRHLILVTKDTENGRARVERIELSKEHDLTSGVGDTEIWLAVFEDENGEHTLLRFEEDGELLRRMRFVSPSAFAGNR